MQCLRGAPPAMTDRWEAFRQRLEPLPSGKCLIGLSGGADSVALTRILLPMHYRTKYNADWPISGPEEFISDIPEQDIRMDAEALRVTAADLDCQPRAVIFRA